MMCVMAPDWTRLGQQLRAARDARGLKQRNVADALGVGRGALHNIEHGAVSQISSTIREYGRLVGWAEGSVEAVLQGGDPKIAQDEPAPPGATEDQSTDSGPPDLSLRVKKALRDGPLLDSRVLRKRTPAGEIVQTIVTRGPGMTQAQLDEALRFYESQGPVIAPHQDDDDAD